MKEDKLALVKAVDSGDTDLGEQVSFTCPTILNQAASLPRLATFAQTPATGQLLPSPRGWWRAPRSSHSVTASLRQGAKPGDAERFLLLR